MSLRKHKAIFNVALSAILWPSRQQKGRRKAPRCRKAGRIISRVTLNIMTYYAHVTFLISLD